MAGRNPRIETLKLFLELFLVVVLFSPINSKAQSPPPAKATVGDATAGKPIFERYCAPCHGISGGGGRGPRLNRAQLSHAPDDASLRAVIADGIPPGMPDA